MHEQLPCCSLSISHLSWTPLPSRAYSHEIVSRRCLKISVISSGPYSGPRFFAGSCAAPCHGHCSQGCPHIHIPASSLLLVSTRSSSTSFLTGLSTTCVRKLTSVLCRSLEHCVCSAHPAEMGVAGTTHKNQDV